MQRIEFLALAHRVVVQMQERVHGIDHDELGVHGLDPLIENRQQARDGELAGNNPGRIQTRFHQTEFVFLLQPRQVQSTAPGILTDGRGPLLEHHQNARLTRLGAMQQALQAH